MILTIPVPAAHVADANHYAMAVGLSTADQMTYGTPSWQDAAGNLYSAASLGVSVGFVNLATSPLHSPAWDTEGVVDLVAAGRAQALIVLWMFGNSTDAPQANPNETTAILDMKGLDALAAMGLTRVAQEV
jgi:hypothetical protein